MAANIVVTALFDFNALDESGLSFKAGDVIQVHNQLISGWWDGTCNGARGWFPCNYVTRPDHLQTPDAEATTWVRQISQDGSIFYVNRFTGESSFPAPTSHDSLQSSPQQSAESPHDSPFASSNQFSSPTARTQSSAGNAALVLPPGWTHFKAEDGASVYYNHESGETSWVPPAGSLAAPLTSDIVKTADGRPVSTISNPRFAAMNDGLPPNWGKKATADGKIYYYNMVTDETIWDINDVNPETGEIVKRAEAPSPHATASVAATSTTMSTGDGRRHSVDADPARLTWSHLINSVTIAIQTLEESAGRNQRDRFISQSSAIVESIRVMLFASGTARRDAPQNEAHRPLRAHYKTIMGALSTLVMAAKLASSVWPPPDAIARMQASTADVLSAVRSFVAAAQEAGVEIRPVAISNPGVNEDTSALNASAPQDLATISPAQPSPPPPPSLHRFTPLTSNSTRTPSVGVTYIARLEAPSIQIIASLENYTNSVIAMITVLVQAIRSGTCDSAKLITEVRQIVMEVGNFLAIVDDLPVDSLSEDVTVDFKVNRLALYNSISGLVMATSTATGQFPPSNAVEQVIVSTTLVEKAVKDLLITTKFLIQEREQREQSNLQEFISTQMYGGKGLQSHGSPGPAKAIYSPTSVTTQMGLPAYGGSFSQNYGFSASSPHSRFSQMPGSPLSHVVVSTQNMVISSPGSSMTEFTPPGRSGSLDQFVSPFHHGGALADAGEYGLDDPLGALARGAPNRRSQKLTKMLGAEIGRLDLPISGYRGPEDFSSANSGPTTGGATMPLATKPWYLHYDYPPEDVVFNMEGRVKGGKLAALVERLTLHDAVDSFYVQAFLLTHRSFTTTSEFFSLLTKRFLLQPPAGLNELELDEWTRLKKKPICLRVFNVMKLWLETFFQDDEEDRAILTEMKVFASNQILEEDAKLSLSLGKELLRLIDRREQGLMKKIVVTDMGRDAPPPILPRTLKRIKFLELDALEIARQLTIIESRMYSKIQPTEFLRKAWSEKESDVALNVKAMIAMSNQVSGWVAQGILSEKDQPKRKKLMVHFISIAEKCRALNNFNTLMAILAGLSTAPIHRLRRTWELVPQRSMQALELLRETMDSTKNFSRYRETLHSVNPPCVPFLGFYLTDLTFIEDGSPNFLKQTAELTATAGSATSPPPSEMINFAKRMKTSEVIREVQQYQNVPYLFTPVPELQQFLQESFITSVDETDLYNLSLQLEPREREDEKIARLLSESGFL
ncbi:ras guanine nucleotide exchange factor domain-containing protein [Zopfochytrium polystomum]|nr:ras guanine nucleotide exchange factor domain-containing protein [Zopfochytrium polystomum]